MKIEVFRNFFEEQVKIFVSRLCRNETQAANGKGSKELRFSADSTWMELYNLHTYKIVNWDEKQAYKEKREREDKEYHKAELKKSMLAALGRATAKKDMPEPDEAVTV